ncbi:toll/interleukin-1 receptor domain-containing protein [Ferrovibrio xuzhouensis]|uniref:Toll/interleukin-1 receptor domain-containing protein n=1 Tax=Ferrovibrio xuzhouensis TaxID=1576914 RepID=A0ABV7VKQ2_9PROT
MPISYRDLRAAAPRIQQRYRSLYEARTAGAKSAFLSHSHLDQELVKGLVAKLQESGWLIYVDWADHTMPNRPNRETAKKIKDKILETTYFLFLATQNSMNSRWCPWEIGYADGTKSIENIFVIPTADDNGITHGNEYLDLYRRIDLTNVNNRLGAFNPTEVNGMFVENIR